MPKKKPEEPLMIVERIQFLCDLFGTNINALEAATGLGQSTIRFWNDHPPAITKVMKVAKYFNVSIDYLVGLSDVRKSYNAAGENLLLKLNLTSEEVRLIAETVSKIRDLRDK